MAAIDRYAVVGNPVAHSLSPTIHGRFAAQTAQALSYQAIELPADGFVEGLRDLQRQGLRGVNVTLPFKREAWAICDRLSRRARDAGAVNTLSFGADGRLAGDNTDGVGLVRDLIGNLQLKIEARRILILGAGGAVRGVLGPLLEQTPQSLTLANRTAARAETLAADFAAHGTLRVCNLDEPGNEAYDLVINGTAAGIAGDVPRLSTAAIGSATVCYDMMYNIEHHTAFVDWALGCGAAQAFDGLGMLVEQAAAAFAIWRGIHPATASVIKLLRSA